MHVNRKSAYTELLFLDGSALGEHMSRMDIKTYLAKRGLNDAQFAQLVPCARSTITRLRNGMAREADELIRNIVAASGGEITADDIVKSINAK